MATKKQKREQLEAKRAADLAETKRLNELALKKDQAARAKRAKAIEDREAAKEAKARARENAQTIRSMAVGV